MEYPEYSVGLISIYSSAIVRDLHPKQN